MDVTTQETPPRKRRYMRVWVLIGAAGLITGAAYASGFAVKPAGTTTADPLGTAATVNGTPGGGQLSSLYANAVTAVAPLNIPSFDGVYANIPETQLFEIDLAAPKTDAYGRSYVGGTFYADVFVTNWAALSPKWSQLNFRVLRAGAGCGAGIINGVLPAVGNNQQMAVDRVDAHVTFSGLAGGSTYCIGLRTETATTQAATANAATAGGIIDGTFMTRPEPLIDPGVTPQFMAVVNRSA